MALPNTPFLLEVGNSRLNESADSLESALAQFGKLAASIERPNAGAETSSRGGGFDEWLAGDFHFGSLLSGDEATIAPSPYTESDNSPLLQQEILYSSTSTPSLFEASQPSHSEPYSMCLTAQDLGLGPVEQAPLPGLTTSTLQRAAAALNIPWSQELEKAVLAQSRKLATSGSLHAEKAPSSASTTTRAVHKRALTPAESESEEILAKRAKNTDAARRSRLKKTVKLESLEVKVSDLEATNTRLNMRIAVLETERTGFLVKEAEQNARIAQLEAKRSAAPSQVRQRANISAQRDENAAIDVSNTSVPDATLLAKSPAPSSNLPAIQHWPASLSRPQFHKRPFKSPFKTPFKSPVPACAGDLIPSEARATGDQTSDSTSRASPTTLASAPLAVSNHQVKSSKRQQELPSPVSKKQAKFSVPPLVQPAIAASPRLTHRAANAPTLHPTISFKKPSTTTMPSNSADSEERCLNVLCIGRGTNITRELNMGDELSFGGKDIEVTSTLDVASYRAGRCFMRNVALAGPVTTSVSVPRTKFKGHAAMANAPELPYTPPQPRHSPDAPHAILLPRPSSTHPRVVRGCSTKRPPGDIGLVDVVVDPILGQHLRPHQKEGVRFLYECVMQMKDINGQGAILADEMGLGKTLQTIALLWTLLKQSPYHGEETAVVRRALVVCPASLIMNWQKEFKKWLGNERLRVFAVDSKSTITDFTLGKVYPVMIIGYEKLRTVQEELKNANFDIIICDEGHRLKTANIKTAQAIRTLSTKRRVILSGTPIQNDLGEFFAMIDFVNPGLLENYSAFKRVFEDPIVRSRQPDCSTLEAALGLERSQELSILTGQFILRRTAQVNYEFLPPKSELVVFCRPSSVQSAVYRHLLESPYLQSCFSMDSSRHLACITALRKLCNSPSLTLHQAELNDSQETNGLYQGVKAVIESSGCDMSSSLAGGKLSFVVSLLRTLKESTSERVVLVSNFTQTLDILENICTQNHYGFFRLDGSTPTSKRQDYVDKFNAPSCQKFVFLLSAKSGGVGLNLIGASRLVMFDIDWNPSVDQQAMARIHREGQPRPVYIYRLLSAGTIEEKMYQRQLTKVGLSDALMDGKSAEKLNKFSMAELRDLFTFHEDERCLTHSLLGCECNSTTLPLEINRGLASSGHLESKCQLEKSNDAGIMDKTSASLAKKELQEWDHIDVEAWRKARSSPGEQEDDDASLISALAVQDRILWRTISGCEDGFDQNWEERGEADEADASCPLGHGPVSFVFLKTTHKEP
ncbi:helicase [Mortierella alpina]|uniref:Helicase n=1 Tax=Mortierella alpina TaxID=64518 RepID=A0A9P6M3K4_MORAP|nr:helicase [Mortierella alpina]